MTVWVCIVSWPSMAWSSLVCESRTCTKLKINFLECEVEVAWCFYHVKMSMFTWLIFQGDLISYYLDTVVGSDYNKSWYLLGDPLFPSISGIKVMKYSCLPRGLCMRSPYYQGSTYLTVLYKLGIFQNLTKPTISNAFELCFLTPQ